MLSPIYRWIPKADGVALWKRERCVASISANRVLILVPKGPDLALVCAGVEDGREIAARWWAEYDLPVGQRPRYAWEVARAAAIKPRPALRLPRGRTPDPKPVPPMPNDPLEAFEEVASRTVGGWEQVRS